MNTPRLLQQALALAALWLAALPSAQSQVMVNEIMYAPSSPEPEWVELFNAGNGSQDVTGWTIQDATTSKATLPNASIPPGGFIVVTKDTVALRKVRAAGGLIVQASLPGLNNDADVVAVRDAAGRTVDSVRYAASWGGLGGVALERRRSGLRPTDPASWGSSQDPTRATPGRRNSLSPADYDVALDTLAFDPAALMVTGQVRNHGLRPSNAITATLYFDADTDGIGSATEELDRIDLPALQPGDSTAVSFAWSRPMLDDPERALVELRMAAEEKPGDNARSVAIRRPPVDAGVVISEIMFDPLSVGGTADAEYVELYNATATSVAIGGWKLYDGTGRAQATVASAAARIAAGGYLLLASDSTVYKRFPYLKDSANVVLIGVASFGLNFDGDDVVLRNPNGATVDSVRYGSSWHRGDIASTKGISLERISASGPPNDPRNWSSSVAPLGGTPASVNSLAIPADSAADALLAITPSTISPDGDGVQDFARIAYRLPARTWRIVVTVYDRYGRLITRLANNELSGSTGEIIWNGMDGGGTALATGFYVIRIEGYDEGGKGLVSAQGTVIVARKL